MPGPTQANRRIAINTPLGPDALLVRRCLVQEQISRLFQIELELTSTRNSINFDEIVGKNVTVRVEVARQQTRHFNGFVCRFVQAPSERNSSIYRATVVPWLWFLTRSADCRIFQSSMEEPPDAMTVPGIIKKVFKDHGFEDFRDDGLSAAYRTWEFCVQYRETAFNFVSRLMEQEGISYFFEHENGRHTLVLTDSINGHTPFTGYETVPYHPHTSGATDRESIIHWTAEKEVQSGSYILNDFNFENPRQAMQRGLVVTSDVTRAHDLSDQAIYDYPGEFQTSSDGETLARLRIEELQARHEILRGQANARGLSAGFKVTLQNHPRPDQNREYLITSVDYQFDEGDPETGAATNADKFVDCEFSAIPATEPFRTARVTPKPQIQGPQTAIVVGPSGDETHTDTHGRVKVQFHWDRHGKADENASCWIRVSQAWAGKSFGAFALPRIGHEVIVEFLEGDPDRPIITGCVYNVDNRPPYTQPTNANVTTFKTNTIKDGQGYNEIRFEDKKGSEQVFIHSQGRMDVRVNSSLYETAGGNREETVGHDDKGDLNRTVCKDLNLHDKGGRYELTDKLRNRTVKEDVVEDHQSKQTVKVTDRLTLNAKEIAIEAEQAVSLKSDTTTVQGAQTLNLKAGTVLIEGTQGIHLKSGSNFVVIDAAGVSVVGTQVMVNSGGAAQGAGAPLTIQDPDIEEPFDAAGASTALPGQHTGGGRAAPRTRTRRRVNLLRAPEPPPPTPLGTTGFGPNTAEEVELVEVVEVTGPAGSTTPTAPCETRRQFVNLTRTVSGTEHKENGRIVFVKARLQWRDTSKTDPLTGRSVRFYAEPDGTNKAPAQLVATLRAGFDGPDSGMNKSVQTAADGWTPAVPFHVSRYGGDTFRIFATLLTTDSGGRAAGQYEVWRKITFEVDAMQRPSGTDYMDVASGVISQFVSAHAGAFTEAIQVGRNSSPTHRRLLNFGDINSFHTSCAEASGARYIHLMYVDTVLTGDTVENQMIFRGVTVPAGATPVRLALDALQATFLTGATGWVVSATWTDPAAATNGTIPSGNFSSPTPTGTYARHRNQGGDFDRWEFDVRLNGTGAPAGARVNITVRYTSQKFLSGVQIAQTTTVAMRFRELRANAGTGFDLANATLQTSIHESSHAFGLASRQRPDGTTNPDFTTGGGGHCTHTTTCVMTPALHEHTAFCDFCSDNLRARKLEQINVQPGDAMA
jgi:type VI secretion system secreted protein VgrG